MATKAISWSSTKKNLQKYIYYFDENHKGKPRNNEVKRSDY